MPDLTQAEKDARDAARYRWMRVAYVDFSDDDFNEALYPLSSCVTPDEVDEAIDSQLAKAGAAAAVPSRSTTWKPRPGSVASRACELFRFLPVGTALRSADLCARIECSTSRISLSLVKAVQHGLLRSQRRGGDVVWMAGDGVQMALPKVLAPIKRAIPTAAQPAVRSVFEQGLACA